MIENKKILIVGLGLIGGSYALALKKKNINCMAIDINDDSILYATEKGIIDNHDLSVEERIKESDFIICSLYPHDTIQWILDNQNNFKENVIITDTCGVKRAIVDRIQDGLKHGEFIASHPMAGRETSGVRNAVANLFCEANFIITPTDKNTLEATNLLFELGECLNFKNIEVLSVDEHDKLIGFLSQLTHAIAVSLMNSQETSHLVRYTGDSFRDLTRIAKINESLWSELFSLNKDILVDEIDLFIQSLEQLKIKIANDDIEGMKELFRSSTLARKRFDK